MCLRLMIGLAYMPRSRTPAAAQSVYTIPCYITNLMPDSAGGDKTFQVPLNLDHRITVLDNKTNFAWPLGANIRSCAHSASVWTNSSRQSWPTNAAVALTKSDLDIEQNHDLRIISDWTTGRSGGGPQGGKSASLNPCTKWLAVKAVSLDRRCRRPFLGISSSHAYTN